MSNDNSKITTDLQVDDPIDLDSKYRMDPHDRRYIDQQALGTQQHLVDLLISGHTGTWGELSASSEAVVPGDCLCVSGRTLIKATDVYITIAGSLAGVCLAAASPNQKVMFAVGGLLTPEITGLGPGTTSPVRINTTTGRLERVSVYTSLDYPAGNCDTNGSLTLSTGNIPTVVLSGSISSGVTTSSVVPGDVLCSANLLDPTKVIKALPAALLSAGVIIGIALQTISAGSIVQYAGVGDVIAAAGLPLGPGVATWVVADSNAHVVRKLIVNAGDFVVGRCDELGNLTVSPARHTGKVIADVRAFGAVCDGSTYDDDAWDAAIAALPSTGGEVYLSGGGISRLQKPKHISKSGVIICGDGPTISQVLTNNLDGPAFIFGPPITPIDTSQPALVGVGNCLTFDGIGHSSYLTFRRSVGLTDIDGINHISWEFAIQPSTNTSQFRSFMASSGRLYFADNVDSCFSFGTNASNKLEANINVGGVVYNLQSAPLVNGTVYEIEITLTGGHLYLFVNGVLSTSVAAAGSLVQKAWEEFTIGGATQDFPDGEFQSFPPAGVQLDAIRISINQAQHTTNFTPTGAKKQYTGAGGTILLLNFDFQSGIFTRGSSSGFNTVWAQTQNGQYISLIEQSGVKDIKITALNSQPVLFFNSNECFVKNVQFEGRTGLTIRNNSYLFKSSDILCLGYVSGYKTFIGIESCSAGGVYAWNGVTQSHGFTFSMVIYSGDDHKIDNFYCGSTFGIYGLIAKSTGNINISSSLISDEENSGTLVSPILIDQVTNMSMRGVAVGASNGVIPYALSLGSGVDNLSLYSCSFVPGVSTTAIIDFHNGFYGNSAVQLIGCSKYHTSTPWTDAGYRTLISIQNSGVLSFDNTGVYQEGGNSQLVFDRIAGNIFGEDDSQSVPYVTGDNQTHSVLTFPLDNNAHTEVDAIVQATWGANSRTWYLRKAYSRNSGGAPVVASDGAGDVDPLPRDTGTPGAVTAAITEVSNSSVINVSGLATTLIDWAIHVDRKIRRKTFKPTDPGSASCYLWLNADMGVTAPGGVISSIIDTSGNGNDMACAGGSELSLFSSRPVLNGKSAFGFITPGHTRVGTNSSLVWGTTYTIIISFEAGAFTNGIDLAWGVVSSRYFGMDHSVPTIINPTLLQSTSGIASGTATILRYEQSVSGTKLYVNGILKGSNATTVGAVTGFTVCNDSTLALPSSSYVRQIIGYNGILSGPDILAVENYLKSDIGMPL